MKHYFCVVHNRDNCPDEGCRRVLIVSELLDYIWCAQGMISSYDGSKFSKEFKERAIVLLTELENLATVEVNKLGKKLAGDQWIPHRP